MRKTSVCQYNASEEPCNTQGDCEAQEGLWSAVCNTLVCNPEGGCQDSTVHCSYGHICTVWCKAANSCRSMAFKGDGEWRLDPRSCGDAGKDNGGSNNCLLPRDVEPVMLMLACPPSGDCSMTCNASNNDHNDYTGGCEGAKLGCPAKHSCNLWCKGRRSCKDVTLEGPGEWRLDVRSCTNATPEKCLLNLSPIALKCNSGVKQCNLTCNAPNSCQSSVLTCPAGHECVIWCKSADSCRNSSLGGPGDWRVDNRSSCGNGCPEILQD